MMRLPEHVDIAIVGAGPVGVLLACELANSGHTVALLEAGRAQDSTTPRDPRLLALSWASYTCLQAAGMWPDDLAHTPIDTVHVSQQGAFGRTVINAADLAVPHLGMTVAYDALQQATRQAVLTHDVALHEQSCVIDIHTLPRYAQLAIQQPTGVKQMTARLVVLAEGGALLDRLPGITRYQHDYQQSAILFQVNCEYPHGHVAYERFAQAGPLALLPDGAGLKGVWTRPQHEIARVCALSDSQLAQELQQAFGDRLGRLTLDGVRSAIPLRLKWVKSCVAQRLVLVGNAAQTMHPVAAQGLNLGLRDASALADILALSGDPGERGRLVHYRQRRRSDSSMVTSWTHALIQVFEQHDPLRRTLRAGAMTLLDVVPPLRRALARHLVFGVGAARS